MKDSFSIVRMDEKNPKWEEAIKRESQLYYRGNDIRSDFERDYTRLLHSESYRRLKHKTQVFYAPQNDHVCTRMEHVQHVASVATTIAKYLGLNEQLTQAIALGHDIGHAPFGHHGEDCLNKLLQADNALSTAPNAPKKFWHERNSLFFADYIETSEDPDIALFTLYKEYGTSNIPRYNGITNRTCEELEFDDDDIHSFDDYIKANGYNSYKEYYKDSKHAITNDYLGGEEGLENITVKVKKMTK